MRATLAPGPGSSSTAAAALEVTRDGDRFGWTFRVFGIKDMTMARRGRVKAAAVAWESPSSVGPAGMQAAGVSCAHVESRRWWPASAAGPTPAL